MLVGVVVSDIWKVLMYREIRFMVGVNVLERSRYGSVEVLEVSRYRKCRGIGSVDVWDKSMYGMS
jgi:hypothetical protein